MSSLFFFSPRLKSIKHILKMSWMFLPCCPPVPILDQNIFSGGQLDIIKRKKREFLSCLETFTDLAELKRGIGRNMIKSSKLIEFYSARLVKFVQSCMLMNPPGYKSCYRYLLQAVETSSSFPRAPRLLTGPPLILSRTYF